MLNLYTKTFCPYSLRVLGANKSIGADLNILDISKNPALKEELISKGGKSQVPYLEDTDNDVSMYESLDIIDYLNNNFGGNKQLEIAEVGNVCPID